ncbi:MAG: peptidylprolyl isomerase [Deltaproteobacteria bacterium]|nr:peptidylprolyl isomerase [Deltaproteobacteria bacterium]
MTQRSAALLFVGLLATCAGCRKSDAPPGPAEGRTPAAVPSATATPDGAEAPAAASGQADAGPAAGEAPARPGCVGDAQRIPQAPDPEQGEFTLEEALAGLPGEGAGLIARLRTGVGELRCTLDSAGAPRTVASFVGLARGVRPWWNPCRGAWVREPLYDGLAFHRLEAGFLAQSGCPIGDGTGGPGFAVPDEPRAEARHDGPGALALALVGPGTGGSQFYVTLAAAPELDRRHTVFGRCGPAEALERLDRAARDGEAVRLLQVAIERAAEAPAGGGA